MQEQAPPQTRTSSASPDSERTSSIVSFDNETR